MLAPALTEGLPAPSQTVVCFLLLHTCSSRLFLSLFSRSPPPPIMYDRAPRLLRLAEGGSTEDHVGPGSYQVPFVKQQAAGSYAPFLSSAARESTFTVASNTEKAVPGPGHYNVSEAQYNIKGGHSLQNREKRFKRIISDGPGPASYDRCSPGTLDIMNGKALEAKERLHLKISRVPTVSRSIYVPSIPSCGWSYGYHINEDDSIIRHFPPASDNTLGPAYYKPQFDFSNATLKYKGIHFGSSLGRLQLPIKSGPGPGQYDVVQKKTPHYENINIKKDQQQNYCLYLPRFYEVIILQEGKKGVPGPGKYDIKSQFQKTESMTSSVNDASPAFLSQSPVGGISDEPPNLTNRSAAFLSRTERTTKLSDMGIPAPGSYDVQKSYEMSQVQHKYMPPRSLVAKIKHASFLSTTPRCLDKMTDGPAPVDSCMS
ncbi:sperm-tail PG-rich repeat-containing protein 2 isoform X6 [Diceros bicornis minor]|uniref:sperm-tail PG-rich repeat-containing protein 2 isoform X6 n=1 Tax=Diceros bicornis minor TaxID=77932 RepID=UPI0026F17263|nr:sperm-tail PG-rich repeat-containing protein 2 isoform X6 [Diceros bicornis minor]